ncbi:MAG: aminotransferase class V-fold PLP-dependent enzyme, partial [Bacteroidetes bacterium]|nr:aminotransferase class V-fold PLP-dependent enzyme [Bacteroidota bacterium]
MTDLASVKSQFILNPQINYLNHGSFGACPKPVFEDYQKWQRMLENDPYQFMLKTGQEYLKASKKALADYINCDQEDLVYVPNPSMAMNI